ncbi:MAG: ATP synthase subunit I [Azonexus sp.]|nr:ATP synthase subunit I [Azonexus sp.]
MHSQVSWIISRQAALAILLSAVAWGMADGNAAVSALVGGLIGIVANLGYAWRAMRLTPGADPIKAYRAQLAGEGLKFVLTLGGFALVFLRYEEVAVVPLFLGYASTFVIFWVALLKKTPG